MVRTDRLRLVPASIELARAEVRDASRFAELLDAAVPENWPPEMLAGALPFFLHLLEANPSWVGWLGWYAVTCRAEGAPEVLIGSVGFKGPPDEDSSVEIGYSVLPQYQGRGYATEMACGLIEWVRKGSRVVRVEAQTADDNLSSRRVLSKLGFAASGPGTDPGSTMYTLVLRPQSST